MQADTTGDESAAPATPPPLEPLRALTHLTINAGLLGCEGLHAPATLFAACPVLRDLQVQSPQPCTACAFAAALFAAAPPLFALSVLDARFEADDPGSGPAFGAALAALPGLLHLDCVGAFDKRCRCSARDLLSPLGRSAALTRLHFQDTDASELFAVVPTLPRLRWLSVDASCASVSAARVTAALQALPALTRLAFTDAALSGSTMAAVAAAIPATPALYSLEVDIDSLNSKAVVALTAAFPALPHLEKLILGSCGLSNKAVAALVRAVSALVSLGLLDLSYNDFDDDALLCLSNGLRGCAALRLLDLSGMPQLSVQSRDALRAALPGVHVCNWGDDGHGGRPQ